MALTIPAEVATKLGFYVYLYVDPRDNSPFYIGKGRGRRVLSHLSVEAESQKRRRISEIRRAGLQPQLEILQHGLPDNETALRIEAAAIDLLGLKLLTNEVRGWRTTNMGRVPLSELRAMYAAKPVEVTHPSILIRINQLYRPGMSADELYEVTRGIWRVGRRRAGAKYAFGVFQGIVREAYRIDQWHPAGSTSFRFRTIDAAKRTHRWEFTGELAPVAVRRLYVGRSVLAYLKTGSQNPIAYVNVGR